MATEAAAERARRAAAATADVPDDFEAEIARCKADPVHFLDTYGVIDDTQGHGDGSGTMPFRLWPDQKTVLAEIHAHDRVEILKARQLGISWLVVGYVLWECKFHPGKAALLFSKGLVEANELIRRIAVLEARLPGWLRAASPIDRPPTMSTVAFANGSVVKSLPATPTAGSSFTASIVVMDEAAKMQFARQLYTAAKPTIDAGGKLIILSTAYGVGNLFHDLWEKAESGENAFRPIFLPWWSRPGRDQAWYDRQVAESVDPESIRQEYPSNSLEAFISSGHVRFPTDWVAAQEANIEDPLSDEELAPYFPELRGLRDVAIYRLPGASRRVGIGCDVAEGLEDGDWDVATAIDLDTWEELARIRGQWEPDEFAVLVHALSVAYGAWVVPERNNHGHAMIVKLRELGNLAIGLGPDDRMGWVTSPKSKPAMIDDLAVGLRDRLVKVRSRQTLRELAEYRKLGNGRTGAPEGKHDDTVMSWAVLIAWIRNAGPIPRAVPVENPMLDRRWGS